VLKCEESEKRARNRVRRVVDAEQAAMMADDIFHVCPPCQPAHNTKRAKRLPVFKPMVTNASQEQRCGIIVSFRE
jgi:hypothetical protein